MLNDGSRVFPFELRALEVFLAVAETGNMTTAAERFGLTQPAISQVVSQLEKQIGTKLVVRRPRPLALTAAGATLHQRAAVLLDEARKILPAVRETLTMKVPLLRVGIIDSLFSAVAPVLGIELQEAIGQLSLRSGLTEEHRSAFTRRHLDIVIAQDPMEDVNALERYPVLQEPYVLLLPGDVKIASISDLSRLARDLPLVRYTERSLTGKEVERYLRRHRLAIPMRQEFDDTAAVMAMVAAGRGWAITTPLCIVDAAVTGSRVVCAPLPGQTLTRRLTVVARSGELGRVPRRIAKIAKEVLEERCFPEVRRMMPWVGEQCRT